MAPTPAELVPILFTDRLTLTLFDWSNPKDIETTIAALNDPVAFENNGDVGVRTEQDLRRWERGSTLSVSTVTAAYKRHRRPIPPDGLASPQIPWYIVHLGVNNPDGEPIGVITLMESKPAIPHIGWQFLYPFAGKGYATEAAREVLRYWRDDFGINVIMAITDQENRGSYHIAEKLGMVPSPKGLLWRGESGGRVIAGEPAPDVVMRCYLTPGAPPFPDGTEFELLRRE